MAIPIKKLFQLLIPRKIQEPVSQPDYGTDMRTIEMWAQQILEAIETIAANAGTGGGGGYVSITGPGSFSSPGALTQAGNWTVGSGGNLHVTGTSTLDGNVSATSGTITVASNVSVHGALSTNNTGDVNLNGLTNAVLSGNSGAAVVTAGPPGAGGSAGAIALQTTAPGLATAGIEVYIVHTVPTFVCTTFAFAFVTTGHIYFYNTSAWVLVA